MVYLDDDLPNHPKIFRAGVQFGPTGPALVLAMYVASIAYARKYLTDGFVPQEFFTTNSLIASGTTGLELAKAMSSRRVKLLHECRGGYTIHDFHAWNKKASEIKEKRSYERKRKQEWRDRQRRGGPNNVPQGQIGDGQNVPHFGTPDVLGHDPRTPIHVQAVQAGGSAADTFPQPCGNLDEPEPDGPDAPTQQQLLKMAFTVLDNEPDGEFADWKQDLKKMLAKHGFAINPADVGAALEQAILVRKLKGATA